MYCLATYLFLGTNVPRLLIQPFMIISVICIVYGELLEGARLTGRPRLRFKDVCKRDMKQCSINTSTWESCAEKCASWRLAVIQGVKKAEEARVTALARKRERRRTRQQPQPSPFVCSRCSRDCHSRVDLLSHSCRCQWGTVYNCLFLLAPPEFTSALFN